MKKGEQSKNKLIDCAAKLFWENGYRATGINDILTAAQLPKGSLYFYFNSKKELAIEVAAYFADMIHQWMIKTAQGKKWEDFVADLVGEMLESAKNNRHFGCPFAVMGLDIAFSEPDIAKQCAESMEKSQNIFESVFLFSGIPEAQAAVLADRAFAMYEGSLLQFRVSKNIEKLNRMQDNLIGLYRDYLKANVCEYATGQ